MQTSGDTRAIASSATEVRFGGHFSRPSTFRLRRLAMASVHVSDGTPAASDSRVDGFMGVWAVALTTDSVVIGGDFTRVGSRVRPGFA